MSDLEEEEDVIDVPREAGEEGVLHAIRYLLRLPRLMEVVIKAPGTIRYRRYVDAAKENRRNIGVNFENLMPGAICRNAEAVELEVTRSASPVAVIGGLFDFVASEKMKPVGFVTGTDTLLWQWYGAEGGPLRSEDEFFGLPLYRDGWAPNSALILAAGYGRDAALLDTKKIYKVEMFLPLRDTEVEV